MLTSPGQITKPELLIIDLKRLRQAGITHLLDVWADAMGLTVKTLSRAHHSTRFAHTTAK